MKRFALLFVCLTLGACGGDHHDNDFEGGDRKVREVRINGEEMNVGETIRTDVYFKTEYEWSEPKDVQIVVRLDPELTYKPGSSSLQVAGDRDRRSPDDIFECEDGSSFLFYDIDNDDDLDYNIEDRYDLRFEVIARAASPMAVIRATAGKHLTFGCGIHSSYQNEDGVVIR